MVVLEPPRLRVAPVRVAVHGSVMEEVEKLEQPDFIKRAPGLVSHFLESVLPLSGGSQMFGTEKDPVGCARAGKLLGSFGIQATFASTLHNSDRKQYLFAFSPRGTSPKVIGGDDTLSRGMKVLNTLKGLKTPIAQVASQLSQRERKCFEWCAMGNTADETAIR